MSGVAVAELGGRRPRLIHLTTIDLSLKGLLAHQLVRFREAGFEVLGASAPGPYVADIEALGIPHLAVPSLGRSWTPGQDAGALRDLVRLFRRERPDIVHTHNPKSGVLGRVAARVAGVRAVVNTVHGLYANPALPPIRRGLISTAERVAFRFSDHELFQSREDFEWATRRRLVPRSRATLLGNGVDLRRFDPAAVDHAAVAALRKGWGADRDAVVVGTVARLVAEKGFAELFEAARSVRALAPSAVFVVVGPEEPSKSDRLDDEVVRRAREDGVVFHGEADARDMPAIYEGFDVFVLASHREGVPRSVIEAQAMERPVVATDIRGCREVVLAGTTGLLVPARDPAALADAIARLAAAEGAGRRDEFGAAGRARMLEHFDEEVVVRRTLEVYRRLLARGRR
jgi:glycosyltransferase involved in cell wall biosynthesis